MYLSDEKYRDLFMSNNEPLDFATEKKNDGHLEQYKAAEILGEEIYGRYTVAFTGDCCC